MKDNKPYQDLANAGVNASIAGEALRKALLELQRIEKAQQGTLRYSWNQFKFACSDLYHQINDFLVRLMTPENKSKT